MAEEDYRHPAAIGVSDHNGWAELVTIGVEVGEPTIVDRRHVELIDKSLPAQPYHHDTMDMPASEAEALIRRVREHVNARALEAMSELLASLDPEMWRVDIFTIRESPIEALPDSIEAIRRNQPVLYAADGMIYHDALVAAASAHNLEIVDYHKNDVLTICCDRLECSADELEEILLQFGKDVGSPWQKEHQMAAAAAIDALYR